MDDAIILFGGMAVMMAISWLMSRIWLNRGRITGALWRLAGWVVCCDYMGGSLFERRRKGSLPGGEK